MKLPFRRVNSPAKTMASRHTTERALAVGVFWLLVAVYALTYVGAFKSGDERIVFSSVDSWVKRGDFTINQIYWADASGLREDGEVVGYFEPGQMLAAVPFYVWGRFLGAAVQGTFLLNIFVTAACGTLVFLSSIALGYRRKAALVATLLYAFATPAWAYSRYFFREPLATLAGLLAFYGVLRYGRDRRPLWLILSILGLGIAVATKLSAGVLLFPLALLAYSYRSHLPQAQGDHRYARILLILAVIILAVLLFLGARMYEDEGLGAFHRFASHIPSMLSTFSDPGRMLVSLFGLTFSPYKGLFIYAPVLLLGLLGAPMFWRRHPREALPIALLLSIYLIGHVLYPIWWGGVCWGPRFLVPVIPFLILMALPIIERVINVINESETRSLRMILLLLGLSILVIVSLLVQSVSVTIDPHKSELNTIDQLLQLPTPPDTAQIVETMTFDWALSPIWGQARLLLAGDTLLDFAWIREETGLGSRVLWQPLLLWVAWLALTIFACWLLWRQPQQALVVGLLAIPLFLGIASLQLLQFREGDKRFDPYEVGWSLSPIIEYLENESSPADILIVNSSFQTDYFLNRLRAPLKWYGFPEQQYPPRRDIREQLDRILEQGRRVWLVRAQPQETDAHRGIEQYLVEQAFKVDELQYGNWSRLMLFLPPEGQEIARKSLHMVQGDEVRLAGYAIQLEAEGMEPVALEVQPDAWMQLRLRWQAIRAMDNDYTVFVQLLDEASQVIWQKDRYPGDGVFPTSQWKTEQDVSDNYAFQLDLAPGNYRLIAGMYDWHTMTRLM